MRKKSNMDKDSELKTIANSPANYLYNAPEYPTKSEVIDGVEVFCFGKSKKGKCTIAVRVDSLESIKDKTGLLLNQLFSDVADTDAKVLLYMILDKLHDSDYQCNQFTFKFTEICDAIGTDRTNTKRIKQTYSRAAWYLYFMPAKFPINGKVQWSHLIRGFNDEIRGGFELTIDDDFIACAKTDLPKTTHDTALYKCPRGLPGCMTIGLIFEDYARRKKAQSGTEINANMLIDYLIPAMPPYLTEDRNYSKLLEWVEIRLDTLKEIGFLSDWNWTPTRPGTAADMDTAKIEYSFTKVHVKPKQLALPTANN